MARVLDGFLEYLAGSPEHTQALRDFIAVMAAQRNKPGGFWGASTLPEAADQAITDSVPAEKLTAVALLSDGASRLVDRFGLVTWRQTMDILAGPGPDELIRQTRVAEAGDPLGERWPRGKTHDDTTAVFVPLNGGIRRFVDPYSLRFTTRLDCISLKTVRRITA